MKKLLFILLFCLSVSTCFAKNFDVFKLAEKATPAQLKNALQRGAKFNVTRSFSDLNEDEDEAEDFLFDSGETPLHRAATYNRHPGSIKFLIEQGIDINALASTGNISIATPLICAVEYKNIPAVKELLRLGADPNFWNGGGWSFNGTSFHIVAFSYDNVDAAREVINALVKAGGDVNKHYEITPSELKELIENEPELKTDRTIFELQTKVKDGEPYFAINKMFSHAANGNFLASLTPLMWAVFCDKPAIAEVLLDFNADVKIRSCEGKTAFDYASRLPSHSKIKNSPVFKRLK